LHEYVTQNNTPIYHFDFYRIKNLNEVYDLGFENYINGENYCFIEWPQNMEQLLDVKNVKIEINVEDEQRVLMLSL
ncbi:MAG: tRNA (adenosine(37)-N6)-threonylcarbamoyltransferase complex ATPase subunit type 1 TsaE, partial [Bacteroidia bacterium]|nr:tRNA (adenosine(37)-N6)-threonylcarbamoyltransferase complex ATPase subunit type 1 TsaE [Bacteroidia bacterium]